MRKRLISTGFAIAVVALGVGASASNDDWRRGPRHVRASLDGWQVVASQSTTGKGNFWAKIDDETMTIEYVLSYEDLESQAFQAHIHLGQRHTNGGMSAYLCGGPTKDPCPAAGEVRGVIVATDVIGPTNQGIAPGEFEELVRAIRSGATYADVHTTGRPSGEIRGQIHPMQRVQFNNHHHNDDNGNHNGSGDHGGEREGDGRP